MPETSIVAAIRKQAAAQRRQREVIVGIGDDCAIIRPRSHADFVFTSDFVIEGRHFTRATHGAAEIGRLALARSLSDLAAMGAEPVFCLVSLATSKALGPRWIRDFYRGLLALAARVKIMLAGGDLASFDHVVADVTCCGRVPKGCALLRSTARPGDLIYVTGQLGGSAHALRSDSGRARMPEPRLQIGVLLRKLGASACMDLSDGLSLDLHRLCLESRVSAEIGNELPISPSATLEDALHGGEDYELLFTAPPSRRIPRTLAGVPVTRIGTITKGRPGAVRFAGRTLKPRGFDHFA